LSMRKERTRTHNPYGSLEVRVVPSDFVYCTKIPWWDLLGPRYQYDVVIHALTLLNRSDEIISLERVTIEGIINGDLLQRNVFDSAEINYMIRPIITRSRLGLRRIVDLILRTDLVISVEQELALDCEIKPSQLLIIPNIYLAFHKRPESVKIGITYRKNEKRKITNLALVID